MSRVARLGDSVAVLKPGLGVETVPLTPDLYDKLDEHFANFKDHVLISQYEFSSDWPTWERHPAGDEVVVLLEGKGTLVLHEEAGERAVELTQTGQYLVVPRNTWHTGRVDEYARMLFITPGEGTENTAQPGC